MQRVNCVASRVSLSLSWLTRFLRLLAAAAAALTNCQSFFFLSMLVRPRSWQRCLLHTAVPRLLPTLAGLRSDVGPRGAYPLNFASKHPIVSYCKGNKTLLSAVEKTLHPPLQRSQTRRQGCLKTRAWHDPTKLGPGGQVHLMIVLSLRMHASQDCFIPRGCAHLEIVLCPDVCGLRLLRVLAWGGGWGDRNRWFKW